MKKLKASLIICLCLAAFSFAQKSDAQGFQFAEGLCIDMDYNLYELDPMTWAWHRRIGNVAAVEGSFYSTNSGSEATFMINRSGEIFQKTWGSWEQRFGVGDAWDIGSYDIDSTYAIRRNSNTIYKYSPNWEGFDWHSDFPADQPRIIEVDEKGTPWVATVMGDIYRYENYEWKMIHRSYRSPHNLNELEFYTYDIGANAGEVYAAGRFGPVNSTQLYRFNGKSFEKAGLDRVLKVDINRDGTIFLIRQHTYDLLYKHPHMPNFIKDEFFGQKNLIDVGM